MRIFLTVVLVLMCSAQYVAACTCAIPPLKYAFKASDAMFVGRAIKVDKSDLHEHFTSATFAILESFKGEFAARDVTVQTSSYGDSCGVYFEEGGIYLLDVREDGGLFYASMCSHTESLVSARARTSVELLRARAWWWALPFSYPGRYPLRSWYHGRF